MSGFPTRPSRGSFGPTYVNRRPVRRRDQEVPEEVVNLLFHQLGGAGLMTPLAWVVVNGATLAITARAEAWNPSGETATPYDPPTITRLAGIPAGGYSIAWEPEYPDETGALITLPAPLWATAFIQSLGSPNPSEVNQRAIAPFTAEVKTWVGGSLTDTTFLAMIG